MNQWIVSYRQFNPSAQRLRETIFTLSNGYFATRGAHEDGLSAMHYPATYLGGIYNRLSSTVDNKQLINEDLVNFPNWLAITFKIENEEWFDINQVEILSYCDLLHLKKGLNKRTLKFKDKKDRIFTISALRFVSQHNPHQGGLSYSITSENWSGPITLRSSLNGDVCNNGVPRYQELNNQHLEIIEKGAFEEKFLYLQVRTTSSHVEVAQVIKTDIYSNHKKINPVSSIISAEKTIHQDFALTIKKNKKIRINKTLSIFTSKDRGIFENLYEAKKLAVKKNTFMELVNNHITCWQQLWYQADIEIETKTQLESTDTIATQQLIRLHIFHTLQTLSNHSIQSDYGVPARGLHGEAYRGHVFWDEVFILPFFIFHFPNIARAMIIYRYNRLDAARELATKNGYEGAMFPWHSASNGEEQTQEYHLNPYSSTWGPDNSCYQRHVNLAIVYNIWAYYEATNDIQFLNEYGAEIIFDIAKFLSSLTSFNTVNNHYEIKNVMGPDEYHESYPNSTEAGLHNNAYTNLMTVWVLEKALSLTKLIQMNQCKTLFKLLAIDHLQLTRWRDITHKMFIPYHEGILSQFEGYEMLKEFDWTAYKQKYGQIERLNRILKAENQNPNEFKIAKQPDTLMLFYLLDDLEIERILSQLGYDYNLTIKNNTIQYYLNRTSHGSTLSKITFAAILFQLEPEMTHYLFKEALISDIEDTQGGTTEEGIHLGVMVGTTSILFKTFAGLSIKNGLLDLAPQLPTWIKRLRFKLLFKQDLYDIEIFSHGFRISLLEQHNPSAAIYFNNNLIELTKNKVINLFE